MLRYASKIIAFGVLILASHAGVFYLLPADDFIMASRDKHERLARSHPPKLILVGGSGLAFGVDSAEIASRTGREVINMGLHVQLGLRYVLDEVMPHVGPDDIVLVIPEYNHFYSFLDGGRELLEALRCRPRGWLRLRSINQVNTLIENYPYYIQRKIKSVLRSSIGLAPPSASGLRYQRSGFNDEGDYVGHLGLLGEDVSERDLFANHQADDDFLRESLAVLNRFSDVLTERGARTFLAYPAIPSTQFTRFREEIERVHKRLVSRCRIRVLGTPEQFSYDPTVFFDTSYHLGEAGRRTRTQDLLGLLPDPL